jgi:hypothetical protein
MAGQEKLSVKLGISGTYHDKKPHYQILFNGNLVKEGDITSPSDVVEYLNFDIDYDTDQATLEIRLTNKEDSDILKDSYEDPEVYNIIGDMLLNIVSLEIDEIDLGMTLHDNCIFKTDLPVNFNGETTDTINQCLNLGWNGTWSLSWTNPFYIWLLESI